MLGKLEDRRRGDSREQDVWMAALTNGPEFEQTSGDGEEQGSLACCSPWGCKELDMTERLNSRCGLARVSGK